MRISVIVPTYKRPDDLKRILGSLLNQLEKPEEILIIIGPGDLESEGIVGEWSTRIDNIKVVHAAKASVVHAFNLGMPLSSGEIICFLDDDVWVPEDWSLKIKSAYAGDNKLGAYGGRDHLKIKDRPDLENPPLARRVGVYRWNGGFVGNHHCGIKESPARVDILKGCNLSFRRSVLQPLQIDTGLEGFGAEMGWENDICQRVIFSDFYAVYDNRNYVLHYPSVRLNYDIRNDLFSPSMPARYFNEGYIMGKFRPGYEIIFFYLRFFILGSRFMPGVIWSMLLLKKHGLRVLILPWRNSLFILRGIRAGLRKKFPSN